MAEYTIEITSYCPNNCNYCSTNASVDGRHLSIEKINIFLQSNNISTTDRINISGGEPIAHPQFWDILQLCKSLTPDVWVYTNAIQKIRYNTDILKEIIVEANVCLVPGKNVYVPKNADNIHLLKLVPQGRATGMKPAKINLSGNNCINCNHIVLQADGEIANAPCKKKYK